MKTLHPVLQAVKGTLPWLSLAALVTGCGSTVEIASSSPHEAIVVDGRLDDWKGEATPIKDERIRVDVRNDTSFVYLSFVTSDRPFLRSIAAGGLTVWFDPSGGKEKSFGIRYPLGVFRDRGFASPEPDFGSERPDPEDRFDLGSEELEILGQDGYEARYQRDAVPGIEARVAFERPTFTYELRVPLHESATMFEAIGAAPGKTIGIGFETRAVTRRREMGRRGMAPPGAAGGMTGGFHGRSGRFRGVRPEPLDQWIQVRLDNSPPTSS